MTANSSSPPVARTALGSVAMAGLLVLIAAILLCWQRSPLTWDDPGSTRLLAAIMVVVVYSFACTLLAMQRSRMPDQHVVTAVTRGNDNADAVLVAFASQTGYAEQLALQTAKSLRATGIAVDLRELSTIDVALLLRTPRALFVVSTTGEGDAPDSAAGFVNEVMGGDIELFDLQVGVLALGDREYANFCAFGHRVAEWLQRAGARPLFDLVEVDNADEGALRHWQHHLGHFAGSPDLPDWQTPDYTRWRLVERRVLNPGSEGSPCFHLALQPVDQELPGWRAGDIAEIGPRHAFIDVERWLGALGLDGAHEVSIEGRAESLRQRAARSLLPLSADVMGLDAQALASRLTPLPHREYSIASIPADGRIELLLRQVRRADGSLGIGSGWLTEYAAVGDEIALRVRVNTNFHAPADGVRMILIGNGTGIGGLRALLKQRIASGQRRHWLIFGERHAIRDFHYREEIGRWHANGAIERLDLAFSRDQHARIYVQQRIEENAAALREWVAAGAAIYVCGSLEGMAPAVDAALRRILGEECMRQLTAHLRYRRDVY